MVSVVDEVAIGRRKNQVVEPDDAGSEQRALRDGAKGVEGAVGAAQAPFESAEAVEIIRINDGESEFFYVNE